jgi:hypothetical protein
MNFITVNGKKVLLGVVLEKTGRPIAYRMIRGKRVPLFPEELHPSSPPTKDHPDETPGLHDDKYGKYVTLDLNNPGTANLKQTLHEWVVGSKAWVAAHPREYLEAVDKETRKKAQDKKWERIQDLEYNASLGDAGVFDRLATKAFLEAHAAYEADPSKQNAAVLEAARLEREITGDICYDIMYSRSRDDERRAIHDLCLKETWTALEGCPEVAQKEANRWGRTLYVFSFAAHDPDKFENRFDNSRYFRMSENAEMPPDEWGAPATLVSVHKPEGEPDKLIDQEIHDMLLEGSWASPEGPHEFAQKEATLTGQPMYVFRYATHDASTLELSPPGTGGTERGSYWKLSYNDELPADEWGAPAVLEAVYKPEGNIGKGLYTVVVNGKQVLFPEKGG